MFAQRCFAITALLILSGNVCCGQQAANEPVTNSLGMKLILVPAGEFVMGSMLSNEQMAERIGGFRPRNPSKKPTARQVVIQQPFFMGAHEVTRAQFKQFVDAIGYLTLAESPDAKPRPGGLGLNQNNRYVFGDFNWKQPGYPSNDSHPVSYVGYNDAIAFCKWLSEKEGRNYRLPTEAEWEYVCRAGTQSIFSFGDSAALAPRFGNLMDVSLTAFIPGLQKNASPFSDGFAFTSPVGSFAPNAWGFYDMHGNVAEWCDPVDKPRSRMVAYRGGSFFSAPIYSTSAHRNGAMPSFGPHNVGFRVVLGPDVPATPAAP